MATTLVVDATSDVPRPTINRMIYGHFAEHLGRCIYDGIWVGEDSSIPNIEGMRTDIIDALRKVKVPVLRWPGGCFADEYHWRDGIGPKDERPTLVNTQWGGVTENNHFGTHEFLRLCELVGCEPYLAVNVGSGSVQEMRDWIEYVTHPGGSPMADLRKANGRDEPWLVKYWGIGNENWGCGGSMRPEYYADLYKHYGTYVRNFGENQIYKIACGAFDGNVNWTDVLMREAGHHMAGLSLHYYTITGPHWHQKGSATEFDASDWFTTMAKASAMEQIVVSHSQAMDKYDPGKRVGMIVDEWGNWFDVEPGTNPGFLYQQNTMRDALVAGLTLNIFNNHADRVHMANLAQTINVLQALVLTEGEKMVLTPTYHVFDLYQVHQDATLLPVTTVGNDRYVDGDRQMPQLNVSASKADDGTVHVSICNLDPGSPADVVVDVRGQAVSGVSGRVLTADEMNARNTFTDSEALVPAALAEGAATVKDGSVSYQAPPMSVTVLALS